MGERSKAYREDWQKQATSVLGKHRLRKQGTDERMREENGADRRCWRRFQRTRHRRQRLFRQEPYRISDHAMRNAESSKNSRSVVEEMRSVWNCIEMSDQKASIPSLKTYAVRELVVQLIYLQSVLLAKGVQLHTFFEEILTDSFSDAISRALQEGMLTQFSVDQNLFSVYSQSFPDELKSCITHSAARFYSIVHIEKLAVHASLSKMKLVNDATAMFLLPKLTRCLMLSHSSITDEFFNSLFEAEAPSNCELGMVSSSPGVGITWEDMYESELEGTAEEGEDHYLLYASLASHPGSFSTVFEVDLSFCFTFTDESLTQITRNLPGYVSYVVFVSLSSFRLRKLSLAGSLPADEGPYWLKRLVQSVKATGSQLCSLNLSYTVQHYLLRACSCIS